MRRRPACGRLRGSGLDQRDRLPEPGRQRGDVAEVARPSDRLDEAEHDLDVGILDDERDVVREAEVCLVARSRPRIGSRAPPSSAAAGSMRPWRRFAPRRRPGPIGMPSPRTGWIEATTPVPKQATPSVFGPMSRMPRSRATAASAASRPRPSSPCSLKPCAATRRLSRRPRRTLAPLRPQVGREHDDGDVDRSGHAPRATGNSGRPRSRPGSG